MNGIVSIALLATLVAVSEAGKPFNATGDIAADYASYLARYYPNYVSTCIDLARFLRFQECHRAYMNHNSTGGCKHKIGFNRFCHMTDAEINSTLNYNLDDGSNAASSNEELRQASAALPATVDWVAAGAVSAIKDQGSCGNCYTFGAAGALEGQYKQKCGILLNVSSEQYTDCSIGYQAALGTRTSCLGSACTSTNFESWKYKGGSSGNQGCNGGSYFSCWAWNNMTSTPSVTAECYPLTSNVGAKVGTCSARTCPNNINVASYVRLPANEAAMASAIATVGPIACSINATPIMHYASGVYNSTVGGTINHAILVVGYGTWSDGTPYWKIKNSWGTDWGQEGYFYIGRGWNIINIASNCGYPIVASC